MSLLPRLKPSEITLIFSNILAVFYAIFSYSDQLLIIYVFWGETAIICAFVFVKMIVVAYYEACDRSRGENPWMLLYEFLVLLALPLGFLFMNACLLFTSLIIITSILDYGGAFPYSQFSDISRLIAFPVGVFFLSHTMSFFSNFICLKEYSQFKGTGTHGMAAMMKNPFMRMMSFQVFGIVTAAIVHATMISALVPAVMLTFAKTLVDLHYHKEEHSRPLHSG